MSPLGGIQCSHRPEVCISLLVSQHWLVLVNCVEGPYENVASEFVPSSLSEFRVTCSS